MWQSDIEAGLTPILYFPLPLLSLPQILISYAFWLMLLILLETSLVAGLLFPEILIYDWFIPSSLIIFFHSSGNKNSCCGWFLVLCQGK